MWQQVSGQINTRFPGFLWCHNPGCGGHWPWGGLASCFLALFFQKQLHLWIWQRWAQANYLKKKKESRFCAINGFAHIWATLKHLFSATLTGLWEVGWMFEKVFVDDLKLNSDTFCARCESALLTCGAQRIHVLNIPFGYRVLVNYCAWTACLKRPPSVFQLISQILLSHNLVLSALK